MGGERSQNGPARLQRASGETLKSRPRRLGFG